MVILGTISPDSIDANLTKKKIANAPSGISTCYGYRANDVYPGTERRIGRNDHLEGGRVIWYQKMPRTVKGIAHRYWPLGSWVVIINPRNNKKVLTRVIDRGPYMFKNPDGTLTIETKHPKNGGYYTGWIDITYPLCVDLVHAGKQRVKYVRVPRGSKWEKELNDKYGRCPYEKTLMTDDFLKWLKNRKKWWKRSRDRCLKRGYW